MSFPLQYVIEDLRRAIERMPTEGADTDAVVQTIERVDSELELHREVMVQSVVPTLERIADALERIAASEKL
jgi:hypothetical protein